MAALGVAGGIIAELADAWEDLLIPLLKDEIEEASVEERVVTASLRVVPEVMRAGVEALFAFFAIFAEDATIPAAVVDVLTPLITALTCASTAAASASAASASSASASAAQQKRQMRRSLQQLLKSNMLLGSIEGGVKAHDLVRDCMIRRAERCEGGLRSLQREAMPLLLGAFDEGGPAASHVGDSLHWHVHQALQPHVAVQADGLIMGVLTHASGAIRAQGVKGVGVGQLRAAADACDTASEHLQAAAIMWAVCAACGGACGPEAHRSWTSLKRLEEAGGGSSESRALEERVLGKLMFASNTPVSIGSDKHNAMLQRMKQLVQLHPSGEAVRSKEAMDSRVMFRIVPFSAGALLEGVMGFPEGGFTHERLVEAAKHWAEAAECMADAAAVAPDATTELVCTSILVWDLMGFPRRHGLDGFSPEEAFGAGGARLRAVIDQYDFDVVYPVAKQMGTGIDQVAYGLEPLGLLMYFGDLAGARAGCAKVVHAHKRMYALVRDGTTSADAIGFETFLAVIALVPALLALGDLDGDLNELRSFLANSTAGAAVDDDAMRTGVRGCAKSFGTWETPDGRFCFSVDTWVLHGRALAALLEDDTEASRAALRAWLPPPAELLRIAHRELFWLCFWATANHPALLCARLHGERAVGGWEAAAEVADGVLRIEAFNKGLRTEALRLLGRAHAELGKRALAAETALLAAAEAAGAQLGWLEMLALRDALQWCVDGDRQGVRSRLRGVTARLAASEEELSSMLGEGILI